MKYFILLLLFPLTVLAQSPQPDYRNDAHFWIYGNNASAIVSTTPVPLITPVPTPTGAPASQRYYITDWIVANSHATVDTDVQLLDNSAVLATCPAAHGEGGCTKGFETPLRGSANGSISCKAITTGASITCSVAGYRSPK